MANKQSVNILFTIEDENLITNNKKGGGTYVTQRAFFHEVERNGEPKRYPREILVFPPKMNGATTPYKKGQYTLAPQSLQVDQRGFLELAFPSLIPIAAVI